LVDSGCRTTTVLLLDCAASTQPPLLLLPASVVSLKLGNRSGRFSTPSLVMSFSLSDEEAIEELLGLTMVVEEVEAADEHERGRARTAAVRLRAFVI
jgi:hypothetical protein